jgi:signal transduction histidine kinase/uncharacterized protein YhfF
VTASTAQANAAERDLLRTIAAGTANVVGKAFFRSLVHHVAVALDADLAFAAEIIDRQAMRAAVLASWSGTEFVLTEGAEFGLEGTPCELLRDRDVVAIPEGAIGAYPTDPLVSRYGLDSYLAILLRGSDGAALGYIGVMSRRRLEATEEEVATLRIFGSRAAAEIERGRHEIALREREAEIAASRARVVHAADQERRRIERNLHDGAQQRLLALTHLLGLAQRQLGDGELEAAVLIRQAHGEATAAFKEVQELARGLHPAALNQQGLRGPLDTLAATLPVPMEIETVPERRLPEVLEVTVYYFVSEAATNAAKHASASVVRVSVVLKGRTLEIEVTDDGVGGASAATGSGLRGLADRIEALGGTLTMESPPGDGTRIAASIPLAPWRDARDPFLEFGHDGDGGSGEQLIQLVLDGKKTAAISLAREWDLEGGPPRIGQRLPVMDHKDHRWGTVEVVRILVVPFGQIDPDIVDPETAGISSIDDWRADQRSFYDGCRDETAVLLGEPGWRLTDEEPMVIVWFRLVEGEAPPSA